MLYYSYLTQGMAMTMAMVMGDPTIITMQRLPRMRPPLERTAAAAATAEMLTTPATRIRRSAI